MGSNWTSFVEVHAGRKDEWKLPRHSGNSVLVDNISTNMHSNRLKSDLEEDIGCSTDTWGKKKISLKIWLRIGNYSKSTSEIMITDAQSVLARYRWSYSLYKAQGTDEGLSSANQLRNWKSEYVFSGEGERFTKWVIPQTGDQIMQVLAGHTNNLDLVVNGLGVTDSSRKWHAMLTFSKLYVCQHGYLIRTCICVEDPFGDFWSYKSHGQWLSKVWCYIH